MVTQARDNGTNKKKYFLFYHTLPNQMSKEHIIIQVNQITNHAQFEVLVDKKDNCFQVLVFAKHDENLLLSTPIHYVDQQLLPSLRSKKLCMNNPCPRKETCFYTHLAILPFPLFSSKVRGWAFKYWQSQIKNVSIPDSIENKVEEQGIEVPSEFYDHVIQFPLHFLQLRPGKRIPFHVLRESLSKISSNSYFVYTWENKSYIVSYVKKNLPIIKKKLIFLQNQNKTEKKKKMSINPPPSQIKLENGQADSVAQGNNGSIPQFYYSYPSNPSYPTPVPTPVNHTSVTTGYQGCRIPEFRDYRNLAKFRTIVHLNSNPSFSLNKFFFFFSSSLTH